MRSQQVLDDAKRAIAHLDSLRTYFIVTDDARFIVGELIAASVTHKDDVTYFDRRNPLGGQPRTLAIPTESIISVSSVPTFSCGNQEVTVHR